MDFCDVWHRSLDANGGTVTIKLKPNSETYTMASGCKDWITIPADTKDSIKKNIHTATVASNISNVQAR